MRINLATPFADKDAAKALGARWDAAKKTWYVQDVADLTPFMRWMPPTKGNANGNANGVTTAAPTRTGRNTGAVVLTSAGTVTESTAKRPHCGCNVLPWENCAHT